MILVRARNGGAAWVLGVGSTKHLDQKVARMHIGKLGGRLDGTRITITVSPPHAPHFAPRRD